MSGKLLNPNHPKKGASIKVEPIRDLKAIKRIKKLLEDSPRDLCLFTVGINTAYRANELVSLKVGQVDYLKAGDRFDLKQSKTSSYRAVTLNPLVIQTIDKWLSKHPDPKPNAPLFRSQRTGDALTVSVVSQMVKRWCGNAGLHGNYASHTMRKTWGYHQRKTHGQAVSLLTRAYGHASEEVTLNYLGIQPEEIEHLYAMEL